MYDHNKGPATAPRHDAYLIGAFSRLPIPCPSPELINAGSRHAKRFRSVPEFIPHALWLLTDPNLVRANCNCKYCNKKPQREITASMGLLPRRSTPSTPLSAPPAALRANTGKAHATAAVTTSSSAFVSTRPARERAKPYAAIRRVPRPVKQPQGPKQNMLRERNADLRSAYAEGIHLRKWYRDGELLWCALNPAIPGLSGEKDGITFWPGIVEEARMKAEAIRYPVPGVNVHVVGANGVRADDSSTATQNGNEPNAENPEVPWTVIQTLSYKMKMLGIPYTCYIPADQVLPYQAHAPSDELIQAIHRVPLDQMNTDTDSFRPTGGSTFVEAAAAYALAVQIAANLAGYWAPTDDWEYKFSVPPHNVSPPSGTPPHAMPVGQPGASLDSVMNASMAFNANLANVTSTAGPSNSSSFAANAHTGSISAPPPLALTQTVTQTRYQGLWWGAERIWTDELVRLKLSRSQIAPAGTQNILPPAGPSLKSLEYTRRFSAAEGDGGAEVGAETRGVFMRVDGLYVAEILRPDGTTGKECRATGMLYELVDEDWEGDLPGGGANGDVGGKGKGKAVEVPATLGNGTSGLGINSPTAARGSPPAMDGVPSTNPKSKERSANEQLSHPVLSSPFPLPFPPEGFKFRSILTPGHEAVLSLNLIAGRYYPRLLRHPLLDSYVEKALNTEGGHVVETSQLWALEGLAPGYYNTMDPVRWRACRVTMVREADKEAHEGLEVHWRARAKERDERQALESGHLAPQPLPTASVGASVSHAPVVRQEDIQPEAMVVD